MDTVLPTVQIVGVRFSRVGKIYHFSASHIEDLRVGDSVIVETSRGWQLGEVAQVKLVPVGHEEGQLKPVDRLATPRDLLLRQTWMAKENDVVTTCRERARELRLSGIKIIAAEYGFDGSRLSILFSSETEDKVDLKSLRSDMQRAFSPSQVDLRQIGPRDVAKILGGMGACGLETRCCAKFLTDFNSISIRMAKEQGISLTPSEITGMCGRLRCCLIYEYQTYCDCRAQLPKRNKRVITPDGEGKVVNLLPLQLAVIVDVVGTGYKTYNKDDIRLAEEGGLPPVKPAQEAAGAASPEPPAERQAPERGPAPRSPQSGRPPAQQGGQPGVQPGERRSGDRRRRGRGRGRNKES